jgi:inorganic triphosphatase YgiF
MRTGPTKTPGRQKASLPTGLDCATAFQKVARGCVASISALLSSACAGDAEAVHQIRVAITRLRAAVSFFAPITVDAEWLRLKKEITWLNAALGAARDSDVMTEYACRKSYQAWARRMSDEHFDQRRIRGQTGSLSALGSVSTPDRGDVRLGQAWAMAGALGEVHPPQGRRAAGSLLPT